MWAKANNDGCSHLWRAQRGGLWTAACGVEWDVAELVKTEADPCFRCLMACASGLSVRQRVALWIG